MSGIQIPNVAVLLAAYNGEKYIEEQILSIIHQININLHLFISIDQSNDQTYDICKNLQKKYSNIILLNQQKIFGSAGKNFYHLLNEVDFSEFDFISLSDQDDIWKPNKLFHGIELLKQKKSEGYSSDVECFWENKKKNKILKKSYPQKKYDYYFEPAGPGCTYILTNKLATAIKEITRSKPNLPFHHDWFFYAFARKNNFKWTIDESANILYRQHSNNQVGANLGLKQKINRLLKLKNGIYRNEISEILESVNIKKEIKLNIKNSVLKNPFLFRRKTSEAIFLYIFAIFNLI